MQKCLKSANYLYFSLPHLKQIDCGVVSNNKAVSVMQRLNNQMLFDKSESNNKETQKLGCKIYISQVQQPELYWYMTYPPYATES